MASGSTIQSEVSKILTSSLGPTHQKFSDREDHRKLMHASLAAINPPNKSNKSNRIGEFEQRFVSSPPRFRWPHKHRPSKSGRAHITRVLG